MEVKAFTDSLFIPLIIYREAFDEQVIMASNTQGIVSLDDWKLTDEMFPVKTDIIRIEVTFDGNINSDDFDRTKAEIFYIVGTQPRFIEYDDSTELTEDQNTNMLKAIINCFSNSMITLPKELQIFNDLLEGEWSYRIETDLMLVPSVSNGVFVFECV